MSATTTLIGTGEAPFRSRGVPAPRHHGPARLARGWLVAAGSASVATVAHVMAHGLAHGPNGYGILADLMQLLISPVWLLTVVLCAPIATLLAGRRISGWATAVILTFGQIIFHGASTLITAAAGTTVTGVVAPGHPDHHVTGIIVNSAETGAVPSAGSAMLMAHLMAALFTTALIVHGQRICLIMIDRTVVVVPRRIFSYTGLGVVPQLQPRIPRSAPRWWIHPCEALFSWHTRGPPTQPCL
ncbi:hypothetical protein [Auritidibacter ignavus]|uniref:hypothetical protein n=1 Tax=Auritidibacter ignavus TaxID=678932 RepID=UPI00244A8159|nr:hypothetical protein [Auritidibacter ignavus]WGH83633.1 hypothetical protein QDX20_10260 [Auritidibacter ignavus]